MKIITKRALLMFVLQCAVAHADPPGGQRVQQASAHRMQEILPYTYTPGNTQAQGHSADGKWHDGLRKFPRDLSIALSPEGALVDDPDSLYSLCIEHVIDLENTSWPYNDDALLGFPKSIPYAKRPSMVLWIYIDFDRIPTAQTSSANTQYFGFRIIGYDQYARQYWSGIFIGRVNGIPYFSYRNLSGTNPIKPILEPGWWTLGLSWSDQPPTDAEIWYGEESPIINGVMCMYAKKGRHTVLTEDDRMQIDDGRSPTNGGEYYPRQQLRYLEAAFLAFATPPTDQSIKPLWLINRLSIYQMLQVPTTNLTYALEPYVRQITVGNMIPGVYHQLRVRDNLSTGTWQVLTNFSGTFDTQSFTDSTVGYSQRFYQVITLP